ncbi:MAG: hypothetical protein IM652_04400, partial [Phenylobacterium sp.]|nr:hypothetical protein [Phenylobacterium sp.]
EGLVAASTFASALTAATGVISAGTSDIVTVVVGTGATAVRYIFADTNADNVIDTAIGLTNGTVATVVDGDFVA